MGLAINYESQPARELIKGLKYSGITAAANELAEFLADFIKNSGLNLKNFYILPIPLSKKRMRERGFNQSELIARNFAKFLGIPSVAIISNAMLRVKHTRQQTKMPDYKERLENVAKCFSVIKEEEIKGRQFIIIDDVFTSGATSAEAVKTLKLAGARKIIVLCAAKA
ncbi:MAG: ComF family protein [Candidatus Liptonbacteria bacterium]|nr:ComF family protein [Candidatus Liptonbacteria bacterium]